MGGRGGQTSRFGCLPAPIWLHQQNPLRRRPTHVLEALTQCFCQRNGRGGALACHQRPVDDHVRFPVVLASVLGPTPLEFVLEREKQMVRQFYLPVLVILEAREIQSVNQILTITLLDVAKYGRGMADHSNRSVAFVKVADQLDRIGI